MGVHCVSTPGRQAHKNSCQSNAMKINIKKALRYFLLVILLAALFLAYRIHSRINPKPTIAESSTSIIGFNHIGLVVKDLESMLTFYQNATQYELIERMNVSQNEAADQLFGQTGVSFETAVLKGPNMLLELTQFDNSSDTMLRKMPPQGPGMTHTCYQSASAVPGYDKFKDAGVDMLSRGDTPIELGNYGVSYAYAYDPEGNMLELEQMSDFVIGLTIGKSWAKKHRLWMTQVAILSPDISKLIDFYEMVLGIAPYRVGRYGDNPAFAEVADLDSLAFHGAWFMLDGRGKKLELMQYEPPHATPNTLTTKTPLDPGYTYSLEVLDIQEEYKRLQEAGVRFISPPQQLGHFWIVYANDADGNVFSLRQALDPAFSLVNF